MSGELMNIASMKNLLIEDTVLLAAIQKGDKKSFDTLFRRYYPILCAYCNRFTELEDTEEIVQDTMLWIWENREHLQIETSFNRYMFKTVYHCAMDKIARNKSQNRANTLFYKKMLEILQNTDYYQIEELKKQIKIAIEALPPTYKESFVMHRFQEMSYKEIASTLGISHKTVDYRIQQALKLLRIHLKDYLPFISFLFFTDPN